MGADVPMFDPDDPAAIAEALWETVSHPDRYVEVNEPARRKARDWTWSRVARRHAEVFRWIEKGRPPDERPDQESI